MNDKLTLAKQQIKLIDIIPGNKQGIFTNPCPFCGHNDHFVINETKNYYISHSKCCKGGTVVDWFVEYEKLSVTDAIRKALNDSGLGLVNKNKINKINQENALKEAKKKREEKLINKLYHRLSTMYRVLSEISNKDAFLLWLMNFLDRYTNFFIEAQKHEIRAKLVYDFKKEFDMQYKNFLGIEKEINERMIINEKEKL